MAATYDTSASSKVLNATSVTYAHTCSGANRVLISGAATDANVDVTGVTYNSVALSPIIADNSSGFSRSELFGLIGPDTGSNNVVVSAASATGIVAGTVSATDADQTTGWHNETSADSGGGTSTTVSVTVTSDTDELVVAVSCNGVDASGVPTATVTGATETQRWNDFNANKTRGVGSTAPGAASVTMSRTLSVADLWSICAVSILPTSAKRFILLRH